MYTDFKNNYLFIIAALGISLSIFIFVSGGQNTAHLWDEGHLVEIITELGFVFGFFAFLYLGLHTKGKSTKFWMFLWAALSLLFWGEEASWGQHFLMYEVPADISSMNVQGEMNLHNLEFLQSQSLQSDDGLSLRNLLTAQNLFQLGFLTYFLVMPIMAKISFFKTLAAKLNVPMPGVKLIVFIWVPIALTICLSVLSLQEPDTKAAMAECREMFYGLGIGMFALALILNFERTGSNSEV